MTVEATPGHWVQGSSGLPGTGSRDEAFQAHTAIPLPGPGCPAGYVAVEGGTCWRVLYGGAFKQCQSQHRAH